MHYRNVKSFISKLLRVSIAKTLLLNYRYFGWGVLHTYILCSHNVRILNHRGTVTLRNYLRGVVRLGFSRATFVDDRSEHTIWDNTGDISFDGDTHIGIGAKLVVRGKLKCGKNFAINGNTCIIANKEIVFGRDCLLSWNSLIMDTDFHPVYDVHNNRLNKDRAIKIGDCCWVGCNVLIKKGTILPDRTIVAAGSVVSNRFEFPNTIIADNAVVRKECYWRMYE